MRPKSLCRLTRVTLLGASVLAGAGPAIAAIDTRTADNDGTLPLPNGQFVTPTFAAGATLQFLNPGLALHPDYVAGFASTSRVSPDGRTLLVLTNGYNRLNTAAGSARDPKASNQYVFVYDIADANKATPALRQVIQVPDIYEGMLWANGTRFYVSGGNGDNVRVYDLGSNGFANTAIIPLNHTSGIGFVSANSAGIALTADGATLVVANMLNDSISVIDTATNAVRYEYDLRPYNTSGQDGVPGGEQPYGVAVHGNTAYVSALRDREVVVLDISGAGPTLIARLKVPGMPNDITLSPDGSRAYTTQDAQDVLSVIDTATNTVIENIDTRAPAGLVPTDVTTRFTGAAPVSVTLSANGATAYVANSGANSVAIIPLSGPAPHGVAALVPTAYDPQSVSLSGDETQMYIVNARSDPGANPPLRAGSLSQLTETKIPGGNKEADLLSNGLNHDQRQLERSTLQSLPVPAATDYARLTAQVARNNFYSVPETEAERATMAFLRNHVQHVIYIVKENRTYDQVLGDLNNGANGDPTLTVFGRRITPNFHRLSNRFVTLDNFLDPGDASMDGWSWSTQALSNDQNNKAQQLLYAGRGLSYDSEGDERNIDVGLTLADRQKYFPDYAAQPGGTANVLPGTANVARQDAGAVFQGSVMWQSALRAGLTVRNYGFFVNTLPTVPSNYPTIRNPFAAGTPFSYALTQELQDKTDPYFLGFDQGYPDVWRVEEWQRDLAVNGLPNLTLLRLSADHIGDGTTAFNTPELQQADNDLAVGRVVETIAKDPAYASNTIIFVTEDDAQDGADHVDSHRSTAYVVGPYVKHRAVISTRYSQINMIRTMEEILGTGYMNLNDALQHPMADVFDVHQAYWTYTPIASPLLRLVLTAVETDQSPVQFAEGPQLFPTHSAAYWRKAFRGFDFSAEDRVPTDLFNEVLWEGLMTGPYPGSHIVPKH